MKRTKIGEKDIAPRRPQLGKKDQMNAATFAMDIKFFCDQYLRAAINMHIKKEIFSRNINFDLEKVAYMLRLMVEYGGENSVLESNMRVTYFVTIDTRFPSGLPTMDEIREIAAAARDAGFTLELRGDRLIARASTTLSKTMRLYARSSTRVLEVFHEMFFHPIDTFWMRNI